MMTQQSDLGQNGCPVFGEKYEDITTGFSGFVTARTESITGHVSVCLEFIGNDGKPDEVWLPAERLKPVEERKVGL